MASLTSALNELPLFEPLATLTGSVQHKRVKRDIGELAWAIPILNDVQNNLTIASRRRTRPAGSREAEGPSSGSTRKQS